MRMFVYQLALAQLVCYDGEGGGDGGSGDGGSGGGAGKTFTQDELNTFLAEDRRKHATKVQALEAKLNETLQNTQLTAQQREELQASVDDLQRQMMTKEQQAAAERKRLQDEASTKLKEAETRATTYETRYRDSTIRRELSDAAVAAGAFNPAQIVTLLAGNTKLVDDKVVVDFNDVHAETGAPIVVQYSPADAVKRMKELEDTHGNLFKSNVQGGIGGNSGKGGKTIDPRKLSTAEYMKLRSTNPEALANL